jgi:hypothetical protein
LTPFAVGPHKGPFCENGLITGNATEHENKKQQATSSAALLSTMATAVKASPPQQHSFRSCSICSFKSYILLSSSDGCGGSSENEVGYGKEQNHPSSSTAGLLDASFVNIYSPIIDTTTNTNSSSRSSGDIDSILNDALSHTSDRIHAAAPPLRGGTFQEASMKMDAYADAAMELIMDGQNNVEKGREKKYFCNVCIER